MGRHRVGGNELRELRYHEERNPADSGDYNDDRDGQSSVFAHAAADAPAIQIAVQSRLTRQYVGVNPSCLSSMYAYRHRRGVAYIGQVPKLWNDTIETHRRAVRDATIDVTVALVAEKGLRAVTMSEIAERTGIGRATLYKYFPDVETILVAWHERQINGHLQQLEEIRDKAAHGAANRLKAVLEAYARLADRSHGHHDADLVGLLHRDPSVAHGRLQVRGMIRDLLIEGAASGELRDDVDPDDLATYCLYAIEAANRLSSKAAVHSLVAVILDGLRSPQQQ